jgi:hypothetical protein
MISRVISSLSSDEQPAMKKSEAYRRYTILVSEARLCQHRKGPMVEKGSPTLVFDEVAHASSPGEHQLGHILDNLGLVLGRQGGEPLGKALSSSISTLRCPGASWFSLNLPPCPAGTGESGSWGVACQHMMKQGEGGSRDILDGHCDEQRLREKSSRWDWLEEFWMWEITTYGPVPSPTWVGDEQQIQQ